MLLSQQQIDFFRRVGYLRLGTLNEQQVFELRKFTDEEFSKATGKIYRNEKGEVAKIYDLYARGGPYVNLIKSELILDPLESILGPNIEFTRYRHNHATINRPGENPSRLHRDILQWSRTTVSVIVYLEESRIENGCTRIIPGSHFFPFTNTPKQGAGVRMQEYEIYKDFAGLDLPVPMSAGGILIFDGSLFHAVGENKSNKTRMGISLSYHSIDELDNRDPSDSHVLVRGERIYRAWN